MTEKRHYYKHCLDALVAYRAGKEVWVESVDCWDDDDNPVWLEPYLLEDTMNHLPEKDLLIDALKVEKDEGWKFFSYGERTYTLPELKEWLESGGKVRRLDWEETDIGIEILYWFLNSEGEFVMKIDWGDGDAGVEEVTPYHAAICADDWVKVEE